MEELVLGDDDELKLDWVKTGDALVVRWDVIGNDRKQMQMSKCVAVYDQYSWLYIRVLTHMVYEAKVIDSRYW